MKQTLYNTFQPNITNRSEVRISGVKITIILIFRHRGRRPEDNPENESYKQDSFFAWRRCLFLVFLLVLPSMVRLFFHSSLIFRIVRQYIFQLLVVLTGSRGSRRRCVSSPFLFFLFSLSRVSTNYQTSCMQNDSAFMGTMTMNAYCHHYRENEPQVFLFLFLFLHVLMTIK